MATSLDDLLADRTSADEEALLTTVFQNEKFPVTDWNIGGTARTMVKAIANGLLSMTSLVKTITSGGLVVLARDLKDANGGEVRAWLDLLAQHFYALSRAEATSTVQRCTLNCLAGFGPILINSGAFIASATPSGNRYIYQGAATVTVPDNGSVTIDLTAESPGSIYADPSGSIVNIVTPLPGLSITNPNQTFGGLDALNRAKKSSAAQGTGTITPTGTPVLVRQIVMTVTASGTAGTSGTLKIEQIASGVRSTLATITPIPTTYAMGDSITLTIANGAGAGFINGDIHTFQTPGSPIMVQGTDAETNAQLADRCIGRWPSLSPNAIADKYVQMIRQASLDAGYGIEKITIQADQIEAGVADILCATSSGAPSGGTITGLQNYVNARSGITEKANVSGAVNKNISILGTVTVRNADIATVKTKADANWAAYIKGLPIGGDRSTGSPGVARLKELEQALMDAGAVDLSGMQLNGAAANLGFSTNEVGVIPAGQEPSNALTWAPVA